MKWFKISSIKFVSQDLHDKIIITDNIQNFIKMLVKYSPVLNIKEVYINQDGKMKINDIRSNWSSNATNNHMLVLLRTKFIPIEIFSIKNFVASTYNIPTNNITVYVLFDLNLIFNKARNYALFNHVIFDNIVSSDIIHVVFNKRLENVFEVELGINSLVYLKNKSTVEFIPVINDNETILEINENVKRYMEKFDARKILYVGYYGTGKTYAARLISRTYNAKLIKVNMQLLFNKYFGETEKKLQILFKLLFEKLPGVYSNKKFIFFFDEFDKLLGQTENCDSEICQLFKRTAGIFAEKISNIKNDNIWIIYAANNFQNVDTLLLRSGRVDMTLKFPVLWLNKYRDTIKQILSQYILNENIVNALLTILFSHRVEFLTMSDIEFLIKNLNKCNNIDDIELLVKGFNFTYKIANLKDEVEKLRAEDDLDFLTFYDFKNSKEVDINET